VLDLLETFARVRDIDVRLERHHDRNEWFCVLSATRVGEPVRGTGRTAREAIMRAL
jgi:hypothetical protein